MQLQAERDHLVHSGIGGGSSSSSPSCSPPKDSPLSLIKVTNLKKPRAKATRDREKERERAKQRDSIKPITMNQPIPLLLSKNPMFNIDVAMDIDHSGDNKADAPDMGMDMDLDNGVVIGEGKGTTCTETQVETRHSNSNSNASDPASTSEGIEHDASDSQPRSSSINLLSTAPVVATNTSIPMAPPVHTNIFVGSTRIAIPRPNLTTTATNSIKSPSRNSHHRNAIRQKDVSATVGATAPQAPRSSWRVTSNSSIKFSSTLSPKPAFSQHPGGGSVFLQTLAKQQQHHPRSSSSSSPSFSPVSGSECAAALGSCGICVCAQDHREHHATDSLSRLPLELLFNVLCHLDVLDLSRVAQTSRLCARMASDNAVWRVKSMQHPLFMERHIQGHRGIVPWLAYYKYLHRNSLIVKRNWAEAKPQAVHVLEGHTGLVSSLEMSMWTLVTGSMDSTLRVWDLRTLQCVQVLRSRQSLTCVSHSERASAACARTSFGGLCIWDTRTGELILQDDTAMPQIASFIYMDEYFIGYGQCDGAVTVFDWSSRQSLEVVGSYQAHEGDVIHISILDRQYVISASTNGETLVYSLKRSRIVERILLPHATQAIQFTPTIHHDKVMFSTRDAVYEYELMLDHLASTQEQEQHLQATGNLDVSKMVGSEQRRGEGNQVPLSASRFAASNHLWSDRGASDSSTSTLTSSSSSSSSSSSTCSVLTGARPPPLSSCSSTRSGPSSGRVWKSSNSLLSQIRQRVGGMGKAFDQERLIIPTRFPRLASICCLPRTWRSLEHGTTSARDSYGVFMPNHCTRLHEISVYTRETKQVRQIHGPAVDAILTEAIRNRFYTTMECNMHCAVVSSGSKVYVISFLPPDL